MGLRQYQAQIGASPEIFAPILNGLAVYRYLSGPQRVDVMRSIYFDFPRGNLTSRLVGLATDLAVAIWPCVILLLHSGYWVVVSKLSNKRTDGTHDEI